MEKEYRLVTFTDGSQTLISASPGTIISVTKDSTSVASDDTLPVDDDAYTTLADNLTTQNINFDTISGDITVTPMAQDLPMQTETPTDAKVSE